MARSRKRAVWWAVESTYGTEPDADGSDYVAVPCLSVGDIVDGKAQLDTNYSTGRQYDTAPITGADAWSLSLEVPVIGLGTAAGDGVAPPADDWFDKLLEHVFGTQVNLTGEGIASIPDTSGFVVDAGDPFDAQHLVCLWEDNIPSASAERAQWVLVTADNGSQDYDVAPAFDAGFTAAADAYGANIYRLDDDGGASMALVVQEDDLEYTLLGGRCTSFVVGAEVGQIVKIRLNFEGDSKSLTTKSGSSLPQAAVAPANTPIKNLLSPVWFNATAYATRRWEFDLGLQTAQYRATSAVNGRSDFQNVGAAPMLTIEPLRTDAILNLKRNGTTGRLLVQMGSGAKSGSVLNTCCIHAEEAVAQEVSLSDDSGIQRQSVRFRVTDKRWFAAGVASQLIQFARA